MFGKRHHQIKSPSGQSSQRRRPTNSSRDQRSGSAFSYYSGARSQSTRTTSQQPVPSRRSGSQGSADDQPRLERQKRLSVHWYNAPSYLALLAIVLGVLFTLSLSSSPRVVVEQVEGVTLSRTNEEYAAQTIKIWQSKWHTRSKLTLNADDIRQQVGNTYTELADVRVQMPLLGRKPTIVLVPSLAALKLQAQNGTFFINSDGKALVDTNIIDQNTSLPTVVDQSDVSIEPGKTVLPSQHVAFLLQLHAQLNEQNLSGALSLSSSVVNQVDFQPTDKSYMVKFLLDDPQTVRQAVGSYIAVSKRLMGEGKTPSQYIDVRIPEKVFYK